MLKQLWCCSICNIDTHSPSEPDTPSLANSESPIHFTSTETLLHKPIAKVEDNSASSASVGVSGASVSASGVSIGASGVSVSVSGVSVANVGISVGDILVAAGMLVAKPLSESHSRSRSPSNNIADIDENSVFPSHSPSINITDADLLTPTQSPLPSHSPSPTPIPILIP